MYSGGKDSTYAIEYCLNRGWDIKYLVSVKPTRTDCFLFHFATVENTPKTAQILGFSHNLITCSVADPKKEAQIVADFVLSNKVKIDALVLGGTGLQVTQIKSLQDALHAFGVEVFATHAGLDEEKVYKEMLSKGYKFMITQVAADGMLKWLGQEITKDNFELLKQDSLKYGFDLMGEGGNYDTFVYDGPIFKTQSLKIDGLQKTFESNYSGHIVFRKAEIVNKAQTDIEKSKNK